MFQFPGFPSMRYGFTHGCLFPGGFPHSDIPGSMAICASPGLFAAYHVFLRLSVPRHPPCALSCLTSHTHAFAYVRPAFLAYASQAVSSATLLLIRYLLKDNSSDVFFLSLTFLSLFLDIRICGFQGTYLAYSATETPDFSGPSVTG